MTETFHASTMIKWISRGVRQEHFLKIVEAPYPAVRLQEHDAWMLT